MTLLVHGMLQRLHKFLCCYTILVSLLSVKFSKLPIAYVASVIWVVWLPRVIYVVHTAAVSFLSIPLSSSSPLQLRFTGLV